MTERPARRLLAAALVVGALAAGGAVAAQTAPPAAGSVPSALDRAEAAYGALTSSRPAPECASAGAGWASACADLAALCDADAALCRGGFAPLAGGDSLVAAERRADGEVRLVALNRTAVDRFLPLPGGAPPAPFVAVFASSGGAGRLPGLVASVGEADVVYGLRVPAYAAVVFRPARPADVRPRGLDE